MTQATDKYPDHLFPEIDPDTEYQFSVVEGQQSGRPYWMLNLSVQDIKRMFAEFLVGHSMTPDRWPNAHSI